ncbi:IS66 family insertion sequence element accessory protein TnpA [Vibrio sp. UCD-FRSSP16_30]|uniref:IS66 family insertion sequence element accessory protein TnpA n=2 Tax=Vibrio sp. UCD-FRSSP16_30 TaxID=1853258 RepID=UPI0012E85762|nr:helix-turn-helix domain-containing protein [Vibrio sp. UCD-FRSSP16_30]
MNQEQKRHHWAQILEQQLNSNSTIKQFCLDNGINYQTFHYWFKKLNKLEEQIQVQPIVVTENNVGYTASVVVLTLHNGIRAELPTNLSASQIKHWIDALQ